MPFDPKLGCTTPGSNGRATHIGDPLTVDQIRELPDSTEVVVTWDGGNGPWPHRIVLDPYGGRCVDNIYTDPILKDYLADQRIPFHRVTVGWDDAARDWWVKSRAGRG